MYKRQAYDNLILSPGASPFVPDLPGISRALTLRNIEDTDATVSYTHLDVYKRQAVFIDRCPHKDFPLSTGRRTFFGRLVCDAHGWEFVADGTCVRAPGRPLSEVAGRHASVVECREADGQLWVRTTPEGTPLVG